MAVLPSQTWDLTFFVAVRNLNGRQFFGPGAAKNCAMADRQQRMSTQSVSWEVEETDDPISGRITQVDEMRQHALDPYSGTVRTNEGGQIRFANQPELLSRE